MTAKEKAIEIFNNWSGNNISKIERLVYSRVLVNMYVEFGTKCETKEYWQAVKRELELL